MTMKSTRTSRERIQMYFKELDNMYKCEADDASDGAETKEKEFMKMLRAATIGPETTSTAQTRSNSYGCGPTSLNRDEKAFMWNETFNLVSEKDQDRRPMSIIKSDSLESTMTDVDEVSEVNSMLHMTFLKLQETFLEGMKKSRRQDIEKKLMLVELTKTLMEDSLKDQDQFLHDVERLQDITKAVSKYFLPSASKHHEINETTSTSTTLDTSSARPEGRGEENSSYTLHNVAAVVDYYESKHMSMERELKELQEQLKQQKQENLTLQNLLLHLVSQGNYQNGHRIFESNLEKNNCSEKEEEKDTSSTISLNALSSRCCSPLMALPSTESIDIIKSRKNENEKDAVSSRKGSGLIDLADDKNKKSGVPAEFFLLSSQESLSADSSTGVFRSMGAWGKKERDEHEENVSSREPGSEARFTNDVGFHPAPLGNSSREDSNHSSRSKKERGHKSRTHSRRNIERSSSTNDNDGKEEHENGGTALKRTKGNDDLNTGDFEEITADNAMEEKVGGRSKDKTDGPGANIARSSSTKKKERSRSSGANKAKDTIDQRSEKNWEFTELVEGSSKNLSENHDSTKSIPMSPERQSRRGRSQHREKTGWPQEKPREAKVVEDNALVKIASCRNGNPRRIPSREASSIPATVTGDGCGGADLADATTSRGIDSNPRDNGSAGNQSCQWPDPYKLHKKLGENTSNTPCRTSSGTLKKRSSKKDKVSNEVESQNKEETNMVHANESGEKNGCNSSGTFSLLPDEGLDAYQSGRFASQSSSPLKSTNMFEDQLSEIKSLFLEAKEGQVHDGLVSDLDRPSLLEENQWIPEENGGGEDGKESKDTFDAFFDSLSTDGADDINDCSPSKLKRDQSGNSSHGRLMNCLSKTKKASAKSLHKLFSSNHGNTNIREHKNHTKNTVGNTTMSSDIARRAHDRTRTSILVNGEHTHKQNENKNLLTAKTWHGSSRKETINMNDLLLRGRN